MFGSVVCLLLFLQIHTEAMMSDDNMKTPDRFLNMTEEEFQVHFGEVPQNEVLAYDVSFFIPVNERGEEISQRVKRDTADNRQTFYNTSILGLSLHLSLTLNEYLLAQNFHIETNHKNGSTTRSASTHKNFYHGHVVSYPGSKVALSGKDKLRGTVSISDDHVFIIHPLPDHLLKNYNNFEENLPHLVIKRSISNKTFEPVDHLKDVNQSYIEKRDFKKPDNEEGNKNKFLEVIYVADQYAVELYGSIDLPEFLLSVGNIVSQLMYDISLANPKVVYVISKILLVNDGTLSYAKDADKMEKLRQITKWAHVNNALNENSTNHADQTMLFTTNNNGGMATQGMICRRYDASGMVSLNGLSSAFITAHETGHSLGYGHDGSKWNKNCQDGAGIMSQYLPAGTAAFIWSRCAREYVRKFLKSDQSSCLNDMATALGPTQSPFLRAKFPGEVFDADKQCEMIFGSGKRQCLTKKTVCSSLYCTRSIHTCSYVLSPPADGTRCGDRHWCIHGKCVDNGSPVIHGNWSEWLEFTPCSRSCGGGIQYRTRKCNNPSPRNGGMACEGPSVGKYRICNVKACPKGLSYRTHQCRKVGYWKAYYISKQACSLWCVRNSKIFYHGKVEDGTRCTNNPYDNDVCVGGICQRVGCDSVYNSEAVNDRCGVCDGGGYNCIKRKIFYTKEFRGYGMSSVLSLMVLKKGSTDIYVTEVRSTYNWIGIRNMKGRYLIRIPSWSKTVYKAGSKITYVHRGSVYKDELTIPGPIQEDLELVFIRIEYGIRTDVIISYFERVDNAPVPPKSLFVWKESEWSECSQKCGGGFRKRTVKCHRKDDMSIVGNRFCSSSPKPRVKEICNTPCSAKWIITEWMPCSKTCGSGIQSRQVICRRNKMFSWVTEEDSACLKPGPVAILERRCNEIMCPPDYLPQAWSECSTSCDEGVSTRKLKCEIINKNGSSELVPVRVCEQNGSPRPLTTKRCNHDTPCQDKALNFVIVGCFRDSKTSSLRLLPEMLENLRPKIDWHNPSATVDECAILASKKGKEYFAIQYYGECRTYEDGKRLDYTRYGISTNFWAGLGGSWTNCVYKFQKNVSVNN